MRTGVRWVVGVVVVVHGLIHLLGAAKGLGWTDVSQLGESISSAMGIAWLAAAVLVVIAGAMLALEARWWWVVGAVAVSISQAVIFTAWTDAKAGTVVNVALLCAVGYGYASRGPRSYSAEYRRQVDIALTQAPQAGDVTEADLAALPEVVAAYVRQSGAVGLPRVGNFHARFHGRIRFGASKPWMRFTGEQLNTYGPAPSRLFFMDATMFGLPVDVLHVFVGPSATMLAKVCSLVPVLNAAGPEMNRGETVTLFNDLCVFAPAALVGAPITWQVVDERHVRGTFTNGEHAVTAELVFNEDGELVDFVSDDRLRTSSDGKEFTPQRWSTPIGDYRTVGGQRLARRGDARWHAPDPEGEFSYLEFSFDEITHNAGLLSASNRHLAPLSSPPPASPPPAPGPDR